MPSSSALAAGAPSVTVVLSTYNRPDALRTAIRSVLRQSFPAWRLLVLGDLCAPSTGEVVRSFPDPRVAFVDLPFRFGEQAGPNSVGMALADTEYTALLNHDDAWLPDHLERALATLAATGADIFIGRAAVASKSVDDGNGGRRPLFDKFTPFPGPPRHHLFDRHFVVCEPASACVLRTATARRVGPWRSHRELHRAPIQDWFLRLWRHGAGFVYGEEITLLNLGTQYQHRSAEGCYAAASPEHAWVDDLLERVPAQKVREALLERLNGPLPARRARKAIRSSNRLAKLLFQLVANRGTAALYHRTGVDVYSGLMTLTGKRRGAALRGLARLRTGAEPPAHANFSLAVERAVAMLRPALDRQGLDRVNLPERHDPCLALLRERRERCGMECAPIPLEEIRRWTLADGALRHDTGGFFSVVGIRGSILAYGPSSPPRLVEQPLIHQPEIGILGILLRTRGCRAEILVQAKAEPGNVEDVQLSPTVQATESNYRRLHGGATTPYLEYFTRRGPWTVLADGRQSEQGMRFLGKYNRNVTVLVRGGGPGPVSESWRWCDVSDVLQALGRDFCVNTDLRSVLAGSDWEALAGGAAPFAAWRGRGGWGEGLLESLLAPDEMAESPFDLLPRALEEFRGSIDVAVGLVPLHELREWKIDGGAIRDVSSRRFEVAGFRVHAPDREVPAWDQPLVRDLAEGEVVLAAQRRKRVLHFLLRPSIEVGFREKAQYGPSWQKAPEGPDEDGPRMADPAGDALARLLSGTEATERLACLQSEEGGRFYRSTSRYRVVELSEGVELPLPRGARFATLSQIRRLLATPGMLTNEARSAVALLLTWLPGPHEAHPFIATPADENRGVFSPDGKWLLYLSTEPGQPELYVVPFPGREGKWLVSSGGAQRGLWLGDGRRILYMTLERKLVAVDVTVSGKELVIGAPRPLLGGRAVTGLMPWSVTRDGKRLLQVIASDEAAAELTLVTNWMEELKR